MFDKYILFPFLEIIKNFGDNKAFYIANRFYTYIEFAQHISKIREALHSTNGYGKNIGLVVNDGIDTYASIFAIWLEGYAYVPLHPLLPIERNTEIISQAEIKIVIDSNGGKSFPNVETIRSATLYFNELKLQPRITSEVELAYILFTSGSTGTPKGVQITRKNIGAFMKSFWETGIQINENDRCLQCFDLTFDVSVQSFLVPLTKGACIYTIPHDQIKYSYVYGLLDDHKLTFGALTPSMIRYLRPYFDEINVPSMRYNILTAEASPVNLIVEWSKCIPNAEIFNFYGPTEATIYCTCHKFKHEITNKHLNGMLSIGKTMPGLKAIIINNENKILSTNQKGELCISGDQVTPGYWKNSDKNKESFFEIVLDGNATRFYKTGDSCYFNEEGDIMLAGRLDHQVKIRGYRIELGEIEYHAREFLKGQNAVAGVFTNHLGNYEIALFVEGTCIDERKLIDHLNSKMPFYMIPTKILAKDIFPLNTSGKVDRIKLMSHLK